MNQWNNQSNNWNNDPFHPYPSMNPLLGDMARLNESFITESHHILLLTLEEAQGVVDDLLGRVDNFFSYRAGPGNIKDSIDGFHFLNRLTTYYNPAGQLIVNFKSLGIKAVEYTLNGHSYIKITGYPGLRRIFQGTRYGARNVQMLEMGVGRVGFFGAITGGIKCCIYFSLAWRAIELIFKSDYRLNDFLIDVPMDAVKAIVAGATIAALGGILFLAGSSILIGPLTILVIGFAMNAGLNILDNEFKLSDKLKSLIRTYVIEQQLMNKRKVKNDNDPFSFPFGPGW